ncbi:family 78 glycoside hydrolase catalytic domain, partial [candidate division KSB1 bacterium]
MRVFTTLSILLLIPFVYICSDNDIEGIEPSELRCEYGINPLGIENKYPRLSWILQSDKYNQKQTAYQILVSSSEDKSENNTSDLWDSGKVASDRSVHIVYKGKELDSGTRCWWKVRVWDKDGNVSGWSEPAFWEMGLLNPADWKGQWISYDCESAPMLRREFIIDKPVKDARVYISGLGYYELSINSSKIGDHVLDPGQTDYEQRVFYIVYDVTQNLRQGENILGVILGDGWYNQTAVNHGRYGWKDVVYGKPRLILQTHIFYTDGSEQILVSDESWRGSTGPITFNNVYAGEYYDARLEKSGWDSPGYDDSAWGKVKVVDSPGGKLLSQKLPPIRRMQTIKPVTIKSPKPGVYVYDMGQNFSGWVKLKVQAEKGVEIQLRFAEWLNDDGTIDPASTGFYATGVVQTDKYICKGEGVEVWEPCFTYHGFQYVEVTGFPGTPALENIEGVVVFTSVEKTGEFECSDEMINRIHRTALWTEIGNMHSIPTDCPHRERCGWLGDAFLTSDMTIYNFNTATFWAKFIRDIDTMRRGGVPDNIAPGRRSGGSDPDWGAAFI